MARDATLRREPVLRAADPSAPRRDDDAAPRGAAEPALRDVLLTTTPTVEGRPVQAYLGIVSGEVLIAADALAPAPAPTGFFSRLRGRAAPASGEGSLAQAREKALRDMRGRATARGADAVLGVTVTTQAVADSVVVTALGTAARIAEAQKP